MNLAGHGGERRRATGKILKWIWTEEGAWTLAGKILLAVLSILLLWAAKQVMLHLLKNFEKRRLFNMAKKKQDTLFVVARNALRVVFFLLALLIVLELFGVHPVSLLATAGVGGIALAFGAQSVIADVITGWFILMEDQFNIGDWIRLGDVEGRVREIGMRRTVIESYSGVLHSIPNSQIKVVSNYQKRNLRADVQVEVPYSILPEEAKGMVERVAARCSESGIHFTELPRWLGVEDTGVRGYRIGIGCETVPGEQWAAARLVRMEMVSELERSNAYRMNE